MALKLSVVILNYNVQHFLQLCLNSVKKAISNIDAEIIVIDNNSADDSCKMVKNLFPEVILIENTENVGFAKANNQAVKQAKGEYVCILNPDTVVQEDTFAKLLSFCETTKNLGAVGCKLVDGRGCFLPESKRNLPVIKVALNKQMGNDDLYYAKHISEDETAKVPILVGAFMFMKRDTYNDHNGFDEDYFMYGEDIDLSYRLLNSGLDNYYFGDTTVLHFKGESTLKDKKYAKRFYGAMQIFYKKHFKRNWFDNSLIWLGVKLANLIAKEPKEEQVIIKDYVAISNRDLSVLKNVLNKPLTVSETLNEVELHTEIIFDANYLSYKTIIQHMAEIGSTDQTTFKIIPENADYLIGSNSSKTQGSVVQF